MFSRRDFLKVGGGGFAAACMAGCDVLSTEPEQQGGQRSGAQGKKGREAPMLAEMVKNGELPPVEERLPKNPLVLEPVERIGQYGGEWNSVFADSGDSNFISQVGYDGLVRWKRPAEMSSWTREDVIPNVAESFEVSEDGTEYTFRLREGMKWSDGEPFSADDIVFWYEAVIQNNELIPAKPTWMTSGDELAVVEKVDDYTVIFRFADPNGLLLTNLAMGAVISTLEPTYYPAHYVRQFHKDYNEDIESLVQQEGAEDWVDLFTLKASPWENTEKPTLYAWVFNQARGDATGRITADRNPYYWKVDPEGSQLPYLDRYIFQLVQDQEALTLKALNGEVDLHRQGATDRDKPVFARNREEGDFHFIDRIVAEMNYRLIIPNLTHPDPVKREVYQNKDFRIGLSHAINRREIIDVVYQEQGEPWQAAPKPDTPLYNERLAKQYTEYDVELANEHLDRVLPDKDSGGMRLGPDGEPFLITFEIASEHAPADDVELVQGYWREVGVDMQIKVQGDTLWGTRVTGNQHDMTEWSGAGGLEALVFPSFYFPYDGTSWFAVGWVNWYNDPNSPDSMEPPPAAKRQMELYQQVRRAVDPEEQVSLFEQILEISAEEFWLMGIVLPSTSYNVVKNNFHNVPEPMFSSGMYATEGPTDPPQYFKTEEA
jgi:peptide/nickel transport system substrate-binding protein